MDREDCTRQILFASLPMYDFPEVRGHTDLLWSEIRDAMLAEGLEDVPERLIHVDREYDAHWASQRIYFSQICGIEVVKRFRDRYRVLATPRFSAPGCVDHCYRSFVVVREDSPYHELEDLRGRVLAFNSYHSHSGTTSVVPLVAPLSERGSFFAETRISGSHDASLEWVRSGEVDVATVDCVSLAVLGRYRPQAVAGIRVLAETPEAPGPPYVAPASVGEDGLARMRTALRRVFDNPKLAGLREALFLGGLDVTDETAYQPILEFLDIGEEHGYGELREAYRMPVRLPLRLSLESATLLRGETLNLSRHGVFIAVSWLPGARACIAGPDLPPVGSEVDLEIEIADPSLTLRVRGVIVRHHEAGEPPGIAVRFIDLDRRTVEIVDAILATAEI